MENSVAWPEQMCLMSKTNNGTKSNLRIASRHPNVQAGSKAED
jgi:hypothetical protein